MRVTDNVEMSLSSSVNKKVKRTNISHARTNSTLQFVLILVDHSVNMQLTVCVCVCMRMCMRACMHACVCECVHLAHGDA